MRIKKLLLVKAILVAFSLIAVVFLSGYVVLRSIYSDKYFYIVKHECAQYSDIDENTINAMIYAESNFDKTAVSNKGAVGLMQILPRTATWLNSITGGDMLEEVNLTDAETNIKLGTAYMAYLIKKFDDERLAIAAYNAGEGNLILWLKNPQYTNSDGYLHTIPFKETRDYVNKVLMAKKMYQRLY